MIKGILFDKDGTLLDFSSTWHDILNKVLKELEKEYNVKPAIIEALKKVSGYLDNGFERESLIQYCATSQIVALWLEIILREGAGQCKQITKNMLIDLFDEKALEEDVSIQVLEGVVELLNYLVKKGYVLGVATADTKPSTIHSLKKAKLYPYFNYIGSDEEGVMPKPAADMAYRFCTQEKLDPKEVLIVGDSVTDMLFAENAKSQFVGLKTPFNHYEVFERHHKKTVEKLQEIITLFNL